jgi:hypothetical protein
LTDESTELTELEPAWDTLTDPECAAELAWLLSDDDANCEDGHGLELCCEELEELADCDDETPEEDIEPAADADPEAELDALEDACREELDEFDELDELKTLDELEAFDEPIALDEEDTDDDCDDDCDDDWANAPTSATSE